MEHVRKRGGAKGLMPQPNIHPSKRKHTVMSVGGKGKKKKPGNKGKILKQL